MENKCNNCFKENYPECEDYKPKMDAKEAINILAKMQNYDSKENVEALEIAISALEKQVPKEPIIKDLSHYEEGSLCIHFERYCPVCKHLVESVYDYCGFCGQAIKNVKE